MMQNKTHKKNKIYRKIKYIYLKIIRSSKNPKFNARGIALGTFIGFTPTMGFQMYIAAVLSPFFKANPILAMALVWITNPWTFIPIYFFNYKVGAKILNIKTKFKLIHNIQNLSNNIWADPKEYINILSRFQIHFWALILGSILIGFICALFSYYITLYLIKKYKEEKEHLRQKKLCKQKTLNI